jgi:hypothetical protein
MKDAVGTQVAVQDLVAVYAGNDVVLGRVTKILGMSSMIDVEVIATANLGGPLVYQTGHPIVRVHRAHTVKVHEQVRVPN